MFPATPVGHQIVFPQYGATGAPFVQAAYPGADTQPGTPFLLRSPYAGVYRLAARLKQGTTRPAEFAQAIQRYLGKGFTYTERPAAAKVPLASFLLDTKAGYCQQFAGAMALLLRMGGVPARVAAGFAPGSRDEKTG
jgi:transglutaminase-like putative cysteine protease